MLNLSSFLPGKRLLLQGRFSQNPRKVTYYAILYKIEIKVTVAAYQSGFHEDFLIGFYFSR